MFSGQPYDGIKQLFYFWGDVDHDVDSPNCESEQYCGNKLPCWRSALLECCGYYTGFFFNQSHEMSRNIWLVFTPYSHMKVTIFHHKIVLNNIYYISQIPIQHKYSTILSASMNIMSFIIEKDNTCMFALAKV